MARSTLVVASFIMGCGGPQPPEVAPAGQQGHLDEAPPSTATAPPPAASSAPGSGVIKLENVMLTAGDPNPKGTFPKAGAADKDCFLRVGLAGSSGRDYEALGAACGTGTGMREYVKRVAGKLDAAHRRDTYLLSMVGGLCYRFFAVADGSISKVTIRVERPNGAFVSTVEAKEPVAILDPGEPWCKRHDRDFHIVIEANGPGVGSYTFGIWARPGPASKSRLPPN